MMTEYKRLRRSQRYGPPPANRQKGKPGNHEKICALINFLEYFKQYTFILAESNCYRLVVIHHGTLETNKCFHTLNAAKRAFARLYNWKPWTPDPIPKWTDLYEPNRQWLTDKLEFLKNYTPCRQNNKRRKRPIKRHQKVSLYA